MSKPTEVNGGFTSRGVAGESRLTAEADQLREEAGAASGAASGGGGERQAAGGREGGDCGGAGRYLKSLHYFTRKDFTFTAEEIADLDKNGVEFTKEFIDELERDLRERGNRP